MAHYRFLFLLLYIAAMIPPLMMIGIANSFQQFTQTWMEYELDAGYNLAVGSVISAILTILMLLLYSRDAKRRDRALSG